MDKDIVKAIRNWCNGRFTKKEDTEALDDKITSQNADFAKSLDQISSDILYSATIKKNVTDEEWGTLKTNKQYITFVTGVKNIKSVTLQAPTPDFPCLAYITTTDGIIGVIAYATLEEAKKYKDFVLHVTYKEAKQESEVGNHAGE